MSERVVAIRGSEWKLRLEREGERWIVHSDQGDPVTVELISVSCGWAELRVNGATRQVPYSGSGGQVELQWDGEIIRAEVSAMRRARRAGAAAHSLSAPMPGQILKIFVELGDVVSKGDPLIVLEAMKMEHQIAAPWNGRIESIGCAVGELVQPGVDLILVAPEEDPA